MFSEEEEPRAGKKSQLKIPKCLKKKIVSVEERSKN